MEMRRNKSIGHFLSKVFNKKAPNPLTEVQDMDDFDLAEERILRNNFSALPKHKCPKNVTHEILRMTVKQEKQSIRSLFDFPIQWKISTGFAGAAAIAVLVLLMSPKHKVEQSLQTTVSEAEVQQAKDQLKWSLAYTSQLLNKSEKKAISEAVINELPKTLRNALTKTVPIFKGGES
ncbi:hypothetical protein HQ585_08710 [candidate division KSB1 bacterium]|nr:hypothetical protein [candidate division KSB1 bacterium]